MSCVPPFLARRQPLWTLRRGGIVDATIQQRLLGGGQIALADARRRGGQTIEVAFCAGIGVDVSSGAGGVHASIEPRVALPTGSSSRSLW